MNQGVIDALTATVMAKRQEMNTKARVLAEVESQKQGLSREYELLASEVSNLVEAIKGMGGPDLDAD